jgi:uncharacterized protein with FMN-binding domain
MVLRRIPILAIVSTFLLGSSAIYGLAGMVDPAMPGSLNTNSVASLDGTYTGAAFDAYWGKVQVTVKVKNGKMVAISVPQYPKHRNTSRSINNRALPLLQREVISAQSTRVNLVSGATLTSEAYLRSLKSALKQAGL